VPKPAPPRNLSVDPALRVEELRNIYATAPVGLCCVDRRLCYVSINDRLAEYNGRPASDHIGRTLREMIPELASEVEPIYQAVLDTGVPQLNVELVGSTAAAPGVMRTWLCSYSPVHDERNRVIRVNTVVHDVTAPRATSAALSEVHKSLRQRDEFLHVVGDQLPQAMLFRVIHPPAGGFQFLYVSKGASEVIGLTPEHLLKDPAAFLGQIIDEDRPRFVEAMENLVQALLPIDQTVRMRWSDGGIHWCHIRSAPRSLGNGAVLCEGIMFNTTSLKEAEEALIESQAQYQAILSALPDLVFLISRDGTYLDVHPRDDARLLVPPDQFLGRKVIEVMPSEYASEFAACLDRVFSQGTAQMDYALTIGGDLRRYEARMVPCGQDRILAIVRDVTESKRAQREAERSRQELAHISRVTLLGEITASLAHELNQPLTAILTNAQAARQNLAAKRLDETETEEILQEIVGASKRAGDVIRRVRTWLTRDQPVLQDLDINQVVSDVEPLIHSELIIRHVALTLDLAPGLPPISADRVQLQQVILNLALNGIEAMHEQRNGNRLLTITTSLAGRGVMMAVRDRGTGIHPDHMDRLFDPFFSTKPTGLGVGLRICWSIVTAHGGRIWAENNPDGGATFFFTLPPAIVSL
jgi:PAS domain S-box-containing protein